MPKKQKEYEELEIADWETIEADRPKIWNPTLPDVDERIEGTVTKIVAGNYGLQLVIVTEPDKEPVTTPSHKLLQSKLELLKEGDYVQITHTGITKLSSGRRAEGYEVRRRK